VALGSGTRLGAYEILTLLGSGGMGEVYRARDTKLGRDIALKILPDTFAHDPERLARFRREAQERLVARWTFPCLRRPSSNAATGSLDSAVGRRSQTDTAGHDACR
jgi:serine/threonine protein kinase